MKPSGFILPGAGTLYIALGAALIIAGLGIALKVQTNRLADKEALIASMKAIGEAQEAKTRKTIEENTKLVKEKNDENATLHAKLGLTAKRLRDANSSRSIVPPATPAASRPELACFDRTELNGALREFTRGLDELIIACESRTIDLNTAKTWAQSIPR